MAAREAYEATLIPKVKSGFATFLLIPGILSTIIGVLWAIDSPGLGLA
jgi:hypothetical protein